MSTVSIRQALEAAVNGISPTISTAWENVPFKPVAGTNYQAIWVKFANPENNEYGSVHRELGFMQVDLMYGLETGTLASQLRAELIRTTFFRGASFVKDGVTVIINATPSIIDGHVDGDRYKTIIRIQFYSNVF